MSVKKNRRLTADQTVDPSVKMSSPPCPDSKSPHRFALFTSLLFVGMLTALFGIALLPDMQFCYRDVGDYYYPLYQYIHEQWLAGHLPLWIPCENLGQPLLANPTSAVFYPLKLIFFLPFSYDLNFKNYILIHFVIAFAGVYRLMRHWDFSRGAATLSAAVYAFGGPVFMQYSNPIYLVGAAWLPWGILFGDRLLRRPNIKPFLGLAAVLALTVFGGEPQTAYFIGLSLCLLLFFYRRSEKRNASDAEIKTPASAGFIRRLFRNRLILLASAALLGGLAAAIQFLPSAEYSVRSDRSLQYNPTSIWDIPAFLSGRQPNEQMAQANTGRSKGEIIADGLFCRRFELKGHQTHLYDFAVPPWRLPELIWPNCGGDNFSNYGWMNAIPNNAVWSATYYMGVIPLVLALGVCRFRGGRTPSESLARWASWLFALGLLTAIGGFGPVWFCRFFHALFTGKPFDPMFTDGDPVGGLFWFLNVFLPGFASFRYSAKLMTVAALGLSVLAGVGFDRLDDARRPQKIALFLLAFSVAGLIFFYAAGTGWLERLTRGKDFVYGPFDPAASLRAILASLTQTISVLTFFLILLYLRNIRPNRSVFIGSALIVLIAADLAAAGRGYVPVLHRSAFSEPSTLAEQLLADANQNRDPNDAARSAVFPRFYQYDRWAPAIFYRVPSDNREMEHAQWKMQKIQPKYSYRHGIGAAPVFGGLLPAEAQLLFSGENFHRKENKRFDNNLVMFLAWLNIDYAATPSEYLQQIPGALFMEGDPDPPPDQPINEAKRSAQIERLIERNWPLNTVLWKNPVRSARVRIQHPKSDGKNDESTISFLTSLQFPAGNPEEGESVRLTEYEPNRLAFEATMKNSGEVVLAEQYWPGWKASARNLNQPDEPARPLEIKDVDKILRRVELPPGSWRVEMVYRPASLYIGAAISTLTIFGTLLVLFFRRKERSGRISSVSSSD